MNILLPKDKCGCPYLILAPMQGMGDRCFRQAMALVGGFDEAIRDFLRVPVNAHVKSLARVYIANELSPIPTTAQIMGSDPDLMAKMAEELTKRGAPRIDVNCGCPSNTVTGRGSGSSLLKDTNKLYNVLKSVVQATNVPVSAKMRSGYKDTSLFTENILAAQDSGVKYITLHPRTKIDGYSTRADWSLITKAKSLLKIPVVGNGDIFTVNDALAVLTTTGCDALMIGRGSVMNPFIFRQIRAHYSQIAYQPSKNDLQNFFENYLAKMPSYYSTKLRINKLKQMLRLIFESHPKLLDKKHSVLSSPHKSAPSLLQFALNSMEDGFD